MKSKELRIGNLLRDKASKTELRVIELNEKDIITYVIDRNKFPLKNGWGLEPIPLTEDILLKCGFNKNNIARISSIFNIDLGRNRMLSVSNIGTPNGFIHICYIDEKIVADAVTIYNWDYDKIYYLHQLQNLYFALTSEELIINL